MKNILMLLFIIDSFAEIFAQNPAQNLQKYWYYRERFLNNYILVGDCDGCSVPSGIRGYLDDPNNYASPILKWGDATIELGWYIGVLATEYKLLADNGQNTTETIKELYYALKAFNRLDQTAEAYMRCHVNSNGNVAAYNSCVDAGIVPQSGDLNGFFIRDDVPTNFVTANTEHFNKGINSTQLTNSITTVISDRTARADGNPPGQNPGNADLSPAEESVDQVLGILMGCALVNKCLPTGGVFYNSLPLNDVDGNTDIRQEARNIVDRMVNWIKYSFEEHFGTPVPLGPLSFNFDYDIPRWTAVNPVNHECVGNIDGDEHNCGLGAYGNFFLLSYGLAVAAEEITGNDYQDDLSSATEGLWQLFQGGSVFCPTSLYISIPGNSNKQIGGIIPFCDNNFFLVAELAAIGNSWIDVLALPYKLNTTATALSVWGSANDYQYLPLLRQVLFGGINLVGRAHYEDFLNSAPCEGPYKFSGSSYPSINWSAPNTLRQPLNRGSGSITVLGEYYGLDYMLLHNLYYIGSGGEDSEGNDLPAYINMLDANLALDFPVVIVIPGGYTTTTTSAIPWFFPGGITIQTYNPPSSISYGSQNNPLEIDRFRQITYSGTVHAVPGNDDETGNVTFRAGEEFSGEGEFEVEAGAEFYAYIDPFECSGTSYARTANSDSSGGGRNYDTGNNTTATNDTGTLLYGMHNPPFQKNNFVPLTYEEEETVVQNNGTPAIVKPDSSVAGNNFTADAKESQNSNAPAFFLLAPNPAQGKAAILSNKPCDFEITVTDILGREIFRGVKKNDTFLLVDLTGSPQGVYFVKVVRDGEVFMQKLIIQ